MRFLDRTSDALRPVRVTRNFTRAAAGAVLMEAGYDDGSPRTVVLCTASVEESVPPWRKGLGAGWVTAEYAMQPGSTSPRKSRERLKTDSRSQEIQRLIGRSLRMAVDLEKLGERTITVDCDVLEANGGTRTLSITGGMIALTDAIRSFQFEPGVNPLVERIAAVSVGIVRGTPLLDLDYSEDSTADVDCNVVMTESGKIVEIQATGEHAAFGTDQLFAMLSLAHKGISELFRKMGSADSGDGCG